MFWFGMTCNSTEMRQLNTRNVREMQTNDRLRAVSLSPARYGVLHVLYIVFFPLLSFGTVKHVLQMAKMYP